MPNRPAAAVVLVLCLAAVPGAAAASEHAKSGASACLAVGGDLSVRLGGRTVVVPAAVFNTKDRVELDGGLTYDIDPGALSLRLVEGDGRIWQVPLTRVGTGRCVGFLAGAGWIVAGGRAAPRAPEPWPEGDR